MALLLNYITDSHKGFNREKNKDSIEILEREKYTLFIVFDGISSSENAIEAIKVVRNFIVDKEDIFLGNQTQAPDLKKLMYEANKFLLSSEIKNGFTTYALVYIDKEDGKSYKISSLGDTRIYLVGNQSIKQLTEDHRLINSPNVVVKYLGMLEYDYRDFDEIDAEISTGMRLLVCSDGFYEFIEKYPIEVHKVLNFKKLGNVKKSLEKIIHLKNQDDASYIFIEITYV